MKVFFRSRSINCFLSRKEQQSWRPQPELCTKTALPLNWSALGRRQHRDRPARLVGVHPEVHPESLCLFNLVRIDSDQPEVTIFFSIDERIPKK